LKVYWFQRDSSFDFNKLSIELESCGFTGILFPWLSYNDDYFMHIANQIDPESKIKYMVAIRPYTVSPQYLSRTNRAMNNISKNRILINFVSGWVSEEEKKVKGIVGDVSDLSSSIERSSYLIKYIESLNERQSILPNFYISVTNKFVFEAAKNNKVIVPYSWYKIEKFELDPIKTMIHISPVIRESQEEIELLDKTNWPQDTDFFTKNNFKEFFYDLKDKGFDGILLSNNLSELETRNIVDVINEITKESMR
jgi:hypothetical protein